MKDFVITMRWVALVCAASFIPSLFTPTAPQTHLALRAVSFGSIAALVMFWLAGLWLNRRRSSWVPVDTGDGEQDG